MVETGRKRIIIDCGPDFRQQMLREHITSIDAILITHGHKDHIGGLDDVRAFNYFLKHPADVFASPKVAAAIRHEYAYAFEKDKYPGAPEIILHEFENQLFNVFGTDIIPIKARHFQQQFVYGFRIGDFTYLTDAVEISPEELNKIRGSRVFVINSLRRRKHYSHFNLEESVKILEEINPEAGYLTHISDQMGTMDELIRELPGFIRPAYDGLSIEV